MAVTNKVITNAIIVMLLCSQLGQTQAWGWCETIGAAIGAGVAVVGAPVILGAAGFSAGQTIFLPSYVCYQSSSLIRINTMIPIIPHLAYSAGYCDNAKLQRKPPSANQSNTSYSRCIILHLIILSIVRNTIIKN